MTAGHARSSCLSCILHDIQQHSPLLCRLRRAESTLKIEFNRSQSLMHLSVGQVAGDRAANLVFLPKGAAVVDIATHGYPETSTWTIRQSGTFPSSGSAMCQCWSSGTDSSQSRRPGQATGPDPRPADCSALVSMPR